MANSEQWVLINETKVMTDSIPTYSKKSGFHPP